MKDIEQIERLLEKYPINKEIMKEIYYEIYRNMCNTLTTEERIRIIEEIKKIIKKYNMDYFFELDENLDLICFYPNGISPFKDYREIFEKDILRNMSILEEPLYRGEYTIMPSDITEKEYTIIKDNNYNKELINDILIYKTLSLFNIKYNKKEMNISRLFKYSELIESQKMHLSTSQLEQEHIILYRLLSAKNDLELLKTKCAPNPYIDKVINIINKRKDCIRLYLPLRIDKIIASLPEYSSIDLNRCLYHDLDSFINDLKIIYSKNELKKQLKKDIML